jgi:hypothetical protein
MVSHATLPTSERSAFSNLPLDLLIGQLRACAAVDLAALAATAKQPQSSEEKSCLSLPAFVAREALGDLADQWHELDAGQWLQLFHFLRCSQVACGNSSPLVGHLCAAEPEFVRMGTGRCEMPGEDLEIDVALVAPMAVWRQRRSLGPDGCKALPLPEKWTIHANTQLEAVAPITHSAQVCAVVPLRWGNGGEAGVNASSQQLLSVTRILNRKGECSVVRTHRSKVHFLTKAQLHIVARSTFQPLLANTLTSFSGCDASLWALVYTNNDPGFFCFG